MHILYDTVFSPTFLKSIPQFKGENVLIRKEPYEGSWEHSFIHMTHRDYYHNSSDPNDRLPDPKRSERLPWVKYIIEHYTCIEDYDCEEILYWEENFRGKIRCHLLYECERFLVVLEKRHFGYFLITSFYLKNDWEIKKRLRKYEAFKKQGTPLV